MGLASRPTGRLRAWLPRGLILLALVIGSGPAAREVRASGSLIQIMPLGDSITYGYDVPTSTPGGYRGTMYQDLTNAGYNIETVGSTNLNANPALPVAASFQEGHVGYLIAGTGPYATFSLNGANLDNWLAANNGVNPNLVLLQVGTNEIEGNYHVQSAPYELAALVTHILELRPKAEILVSTISPLANAALNSEVNAYNNALSGPNGIIAQLRAAGENVQLVNAGGTLTVADLSADGIHPSAEGYQKLGHAWALAVEDAMPIYTAPEPSTFLLFGAGCLVVIPIARARLKAR